MDIKKAFNIFKNNKLDNLFSVNKSRKNPYFNMIEISKNKVVKKIKNINSKTVVRRQDAPKVYDMNASIYFGKEIFYLKKIIYLEKNLVFMLCLFFDLLI